MNRITTARAEQEIKFPVAQPSIGKLILLDHTARLTAGVLDPRSMS